MDHTEEYYSFYKALKKIRFWRFLFFMVIMIFLFALGMIFLSQKSGFKFFNNAYIARIHIQDVIMDESEYAKEIYELAKDDSLKAAVIYIDSPGGTTVDSEILYQALSHLKTKKPIVTYMHNIAASGGYITALAADHIVARGNTITGSIGVIMQVPNFTGLMDKVGINMLTVRSSELKGEPTPFTKITAQGKENLNSIIQDTQSWFLQLVKTRRPNMSAEHFKQATNGGIFSGRQAAELGLIDSTGSEQTALQWLQKHHKIDSSLKKIDIEKPIDFSEHLFENSISQFLEYFFGVSVKKSIKSPLMIDGLLSIWQG